MPQKNQHQIGITFTRVETQSLLQHEEEHYRQSTPSEPEGCYQPEIQPPMQQDNNHCQPLTPFRIHLIFICNHNFTQKKLS